MSEKNLYLYLIVLCFCKDLNLLSIDLTFYTVAAHSELRTAPDTFSLNENLSLFIMTFLKKVLTFDIELQFLKCAATV